jgi:hypothetical protein
MAVSAEEAQRRVLDALVAMDDGTGVTLTAFSLGLRAVMRDPEMPPSVVALYGAMAELAESVRDDMAVRKASR